MPPLAELQRGFSRAVFTGTAPALAFRTGPIPAAAALQIHRNTVMAALVNALRLAFPTVDALVGSDFFDQTASAFAATHPPTSARLIGYGADFPDFLQRAAPLPYLADVARLDWGIEQALLAPAAQARFVLDDTVTLEWPVSLTVLALNHPADLIRASLGDDAALAAIDLTPAPREILIWRNARQAAVRAVSPASAAFVRTLLKGCDAQEALAAAMQAAPDAALQTLQTEIFAASFCNVISTGEPS